MLSAVSKDITFVLQVIAAISFQIASVDSQYAEIPLAAVSQSFQRKVRT